MQEYCHTEVACIPERAGERRSAASGAWLYSEKTLREIRDQEKAVTRGIIPERPNWHAQRSG